MGRVGLWVALVLTLGFGGCTWMYPTAVPMQTRAYPGLSASTAPVVGPERRLLILLPGRGDDADAFAFHGFIDDVRASGAPIDIVTADAHLGYYLRSTFTERIWTDVIAPARARGYRHIWMAGVSMGGLGSLASAQDHPKAIEGLILIAPYLGTDRVLEGIERQGGARRWSATDPNDRYQQLWTWLKGARDPAAGLPQIVLAYGHEDRLHAGHRLLAELLRPEQVTEIHGTHDWTTWRKLWRAYWNPASPRGLALARR